MTHMWTNLKPCLLHTCLFLLWPILIFPVSLPVTSELLQHSLNWPPCLQSSMTLLWCSGLSPTFQYAYKVPDDSGPILLCSHISCSSPPTSKLHNDNGFLNSFYFLEPHHALAHLWSFLHIFPWFGILSPYLWLNNSYSSFKIRLIST